MKKIAIILGLLFPLLFLLPYAFQSAKKKIKSDFGQPVASSVKPTISPTIVIVVKNNEEKTSVFVPYWTVSSKFDADDFDRLIYFGIFANSSGVDESEAGYENMRRFVAAAKGNKTLLTLRMLDSTANAAILKDKNLQQKVVDETVVIAKRYGFDGVVLDLELTAFPFESTIKQINEFVLLLDAETNKHDLHFAVALYGDTFYRVRPFEVKTIAKYADEIMVMAYDFHKARGNPGPNFPLGGRDVYGYDFTKMIDDYVQFVPTDKLTVIFGLFGYDWEVDDQQKALSQGVSLSTYKAKQQLVDACAFSDCVVKRDPISSETKVTYADQGKKHVVWFEDLESVEKKKEYLKTKGISSYSFWAYSYF